MPRRAILFAFAALLLVLAPSILSPSAGAEEKEAERPNPMRVFRSVLDERARMITVPLHDDMWLAYDATDCALYKAWTGDVKFDGAVYTTVHGPQPTARGAPPTSMRRLRRCRRPSGPTAMQGMLRVDGKAQVRDRPVRWATAWTEDQVALRYELSAAGARREGITRDARSSSVADDPARPVLERHITVVLGSWCAKGRCRAAPDVVLPRWDRPRTASGVTSKSDAGLSGLLPRSRRSKDGHGVANTVTYGERPCDPAGRGRTSASATPSTRSASWLPRPKHAAQGRGRQDRDKEGGRRGAQARRPRAPQGHAAWATASRVRIYQIGEDDGPASDAGQRPDAELVARRARPRPAHRARRLRQGRGSLPYPRRRLPRDSGRG